MVSPQQQQRKMSIRSPQRSPHPKRPWRLSRMMISLIGVYGILLYQMLFSTTNYNHYQRNQSTNESGGFLSATLEFQQHKSWATQQPIHVVNNPFFKLIQQSNDNLDDSNKNNKNINDPNLLVPRRTDFKNGILEGSPQNNRTDGNLWDQSTVIPLWMKHYFQWHQQERKQVLVDDRRSNWHNSRFLVMECTSNYQHCGGVADRLGPLPYGIVVANQTNRILLIHWTKPTMLEEFVVPPQHGMNWHVPEWFWKQMERESNNVATTAFATYGDSIVEMASSNISLVRIKFQSHDHGANYYNRMARSSRNDPTFDQVMHDVWRVFFTPTPPIASRIEQQLQRHQLVPGQYMATHVRAFYGVSERDDSIIKWWAQNAIHCVTEHFYNESVQQYKYKTVNLPSLEPPPILFVSDSTYATHVATEYGRDQGVPVVSRMHVSEPLHLEKDVDDVADPSKFYDSFVDLYMIGMSQCTAYNVGGFGRLGSMIGYNSSCVLQMKANMIRCGLKYRGKVSDIQSVAKGSNSTLLAIQQRDHLTQSRLQGPLFIPPSDGVEDLVYSSKANNDQTGDIQTSNQAQPIIISTATAPAYKPWASQNRLNLWDESTRIPPWMKHYFDWHTAQRQRLQKYPNQWENQRVLIMQCYDTDEKCGGTADRLKPLPMFVRLAHTTNRLLLILWSRPAKLEEFLVPPKGGIDWRVPDWLKLYYVANGVYPISCPELLAYSEAREFNIVRTRFQSNTGGADLYDENLLPEEPRFEQIYHDVWQAFFTPSPPIALTIQSELDQNGLVPGNYASAHLRALYGVEHRGANQQALWAMNVINCASNLRPGKPIYFAGDSAYATEVALAYGEWLKSPVVSHKSYPNPPLHLDKAEHLSNKTDNKFMSKEQLNLMRRPPSDYYDTFIDLYLLALGGCVSYFKGGYGNWALQIGGNITCYNKMIRIFQKGIKDPCNWTATDENPRYWKEFKKKQKQKGNIPPSRPIFNEPMDPLI